MKLFVVLALAFAVAAAAPASTNPDANAEIIEQDSTNIGTPDGYRASYKTSNGIQAAEEGAIADQGTENEGLEQRGFYEYLGVDGNLYRVDWTAGRNGFRPSGNHIPV